LPPPPPPLEIVKSVCVFCALVVIYAFFLQPGLCWGTFVLRSLICPPPEKNPAGAHGDKRNYEFISAGGSVFSRPFRPFLSFPFLLPSIAFLSSFPTCISTPLRLRRFGWGTRIRSTESTSGASQYYRRLSVSSTAYATSVW